LFHAVSAVQQGRSLSAMYCPECSAPIFDTALSKKHAGTHLCMKCKLLFKVDGNAVANPLANFVKATRAFAKLPS
jgi:predicted RNA-binding Zn-ribbon protein involved in translation (DUF1610 family)